MNSNNQPNGGMHANSRQGGPQSAGAQKINKNQGQAPGMLKFNIGSNNNFIVKNSNIVITDNHAQGGQQAHIYPQTQNFNQPMPKQQQSKSGGGSRQPMGAQPMGNFNIDPKQKMYTQQNQPNSQKFGKSQGQGFHPSQKGMVNGRQQKFVGPGPLQGGQQFMQNMNSATNAQQMNILAMNANNNGQMPSSMPNSTMSNPVGGYAHKQRQLNYSPAMPAPQATQNIIGRFGGQGKPPGQPKKRNVSEAGVHLNGQKINGNGLENSMNGVPSRRSQSKTDQYKDGELMKFPNKLQQQSASSRMSPMGFTANTNVPAGGAASEMQRRAMVQGGSRERNQAMNNSLPSGNPGSGLGLYINRPQSATQKQKNAQTPVPGQQPDSMNSGVRYLLQQNAAQNRDSKKMKMMNGQTGFSASRQQQNTQFKTSGPPARQGDGSQITNDYLNGLINHGQKNQNDRNGSKQKAHSLYQSNEQKRSHSQTAGQNGPNILQESNDYTQQQRSRGKQRQVSQNSNSNNSLNQKPSPQLSSNKRPKSDLIDPQLPQIDNQNPKQAKNNLTGPVADESPSGQNNVLNQRNQVRNQQKSQRINQSQPTGPTKSIIPPTTVLKPNAQSQAQATALGANQQLKDATGPAQPSNKQQPGKEGKAPQQIPKNSYYSSNPKQMFTNCVTKFAFATKTGLSPSNPHKVNQDRWITVPHFCGLKYCHFFAVADGHGQHGQEVSGYLKTRLPQHTEAEMRYMFTQYSEYLQKKQIDELLNTDEICIAFNNAFLNCNEELFNGNLDIRFSGSTCVSIMTLGQKLFCSNVGDSRGIVCKMTDGKIQAQAISRDQKPEQADEAARIQRCGGRIDSFRDHNKEPIGPLRVWLLKEDIPGLAMTRSFGDEVASRVGVNGEPEILELDLQKDDKFIVLASDGIWDFLSNEEVSKIVAPFFEIKNAEKAAEALVREGYLRWKREEEGIVDDITCVIVFLDVKLPQQDPNPNLVQHEKAAAAAATASLTSEVDPKTTESDKQVVTKPSAAGSESPARSNKETDNNKNNNKNAKID